MSYFSFDSGRFPKKDLLLKFFQFFEIIQSSTAMMGSLVSISKMSQFVIVIIPLEDFNIVVLILVMEHALVNVLNGNLV